MVRAGEAEKRLPTLALDTEIRFRSAAERAAFTEDLAGAVSALAARYHDTGRSRRPLAPAGGGRLPSAEPRCSVPGRGPRCPVRRRWRVGGRPAPTSTAGPGRRTRDPGLRISPKEAPPVSDVADLTYREPPASLTALVDAPELPAVSLSPDRRWLLLLETPPLPSIEELAEPELRLAGLRLNPRTNGPSRTNPYRSLALLPPARPSPPLPPQPGPGRRPPPARRPAARPVQGLPDGARISGVRWSPDGAWVAFTLVEADGLALWLLDVAAGAARRLTAPRLDTGLSAAPTTGRRTTAPSSASWCPQTGGPRRSRRACRPARWCSRPARSRRPPGRSRTCCGVRPTRTASSTTSPPRSCGWAWTGSSDGSVARGCTGTPSPLRTAPTCWWRACAGPSRTSSRPTASPPGWRSGTPPGRRSASSPTCPWRRTCLRCGAPCAPAGGRSAGARTRRPRWPGRRPRTAAIRARRRPSATASTSSPPRSTAPRPS